MVLALDPVVVCAARIEHGGADALGGLVARESLAAISSSPAPPMRDAVPSK